MAVTEPSVLEMNGVGSISPSASPSPHTSVYNTPRASMSRRSSSRRDVSSSTTFSHEPTDDSSPPPMPHYDAAQHTDGKHETDVDEDISPLDPRRFTPTLHASLVSEILNLRRELDLKHEFIDELEANLQKTRNEKEDSDRQISALEKDCRTLKKQLSQLESGTLSAVEELTKDRDGAKKQYLDTKSKVDDLQEKLKKKEEESYRTHTAWEKEQDAWSIERRGHERKVHVAETRLKQALAEIEAMHAAQANMAQQQDDVTRDSGVGDESDNASQASPVRTNRNSSRMSMIKHRFSIQSLTGADGQKLNGISLADELHLDEEDEDLASEADSEINTPEKKANQGLVSKVTQMFDERAKRNSLSLSEQRRVLQGPVDFSRKRAESSARPTSLKNVYVDVGIQYESSVFGLGFETKNYGASAEATLLDDNSTQTEPFTFVTGNEHSLAHTLELQDSTELMDAKEPVLMVTTSSQTEEFAPDQTTTALGRNDVIVHAIPTTQEMRTISTQTDFGAVNEPKTLASKHSLANITIPSINIVPPPSAPSSPKEPRLPPGTRSVDSQTEPELFLVSVSVQTEEIRVDARLNKLPPHLHPAAVSSNPPTPELKFRAGLPNPLIAKSIPRPGTRSNDEDTSQPSAISKKLVTKVGASTGSTAERVEGLRKLLRSSVLEKSPESDVGSTNDEYHIADIEQKVPLYSTPSISSRSLKHLRSMGGSRPSPVPEEKDEHDHPPDPLPVDSAMASMQSIASGRSSLDTSYRENDRMKNQSTKANSKIRRSIGPQSAGTSHRSRTPSIVSVGSSSRFSSRSAGPPFPVPDRGSSRKNLSTRSEGSTSPTPRSGGIFGTRRRGIANVARKDSLRKVRSATVIQRTGSRGKSRSRSRTPPLAGQRVSPTFITPSQEPKRSSKPKAPRKSVDKQIAQRPTSSKSPELSRASQGTVVDAIAATMVGEWMWKYVRRRTSFGVPESPQEPMGRPGTDGSMNVTGNGIRHKRWVWLSPYERAIMWSSKQPASNNALMGKSGRKLVIQSVLDVRDDTPLPKNHGIAEPFNRSILILTPARALKFTAMSKERHYTWLTALSFLAHSPLLTSGNINLQSGSAPVPGPALPQFDVSAQEPPRSRGAGLKRGGIKDSVRIAKDRARPVRNERTNVQQGRIPDIEFEAAFGNNNAIPPMPRLPQLPEMQVVAAEPPTVPRFAHGRNRSLTGPKLPASTLRSLGYKEVPSPSFPVSALPSPGAEYPSTRTSLASATTRSTFLDSVGTIRMEAFIEEQNKTLLSQSPLLSGGSSRRFANQTPSPGQLADMKLNTLPDDYVIGEKFDPFKDFH